tara:strand:- start:212 stop:598 length:387 start_codon:yes stop_codon:yes gene_type:complete
MKKTVCFFINYFLLILFLTGCGTQNSVSNSAGPSSPSNLIMNLEANPSSVSSGGSSTITVTVKNDTTGIVESGVTVNAVIGAGGTLDAATGDTDTNGQVFFAVTATTAVTATFTLEDISSSIRINVNA